MTSSTETTDLSQTTCLKTLSEQLNPELIRRLDPKKREALSAYLKWEAAARDPCGRLFIHQAHKNHSQATPGSSIHTAI